MTITVWLLDLRTSIAGHMGARSASTVSAWAAARSQAADRLLCHAAVQTFGVREDSVQVVRRRNSPPSVSVAGAVQVYASLSHSGPWVSAAVATTPIGVDIEAPTRRRDVIAMSEWFFSSDEHAWLARQPDHEEAFYRLWTGKEAVLKLQGAQGGDDALADIRFRVSNDDLLPPPGAAVWFGRLSEFDSTLRCSMAVAGTAAIEPVRRVAQFESLSLPSL